MPPRLLERLAQIPAAKSTGRALVRNAAVATSSWRPLPEFLLIGAKRSGTTSLFRYLLEHPQVLSLVPSAKRLPLREDMKGVHFFDSHWDRGLPWYRSHFATSLARRRAAERLGRPVVAGEGSPYYLFHPRAAERAARTVPGARLVVLLRDPVERTFSAWKEQRRNGVESLGFEEALAAEPERTRGEEERLAREPAGRSAAHEHLAYRRQSEYVDGLERWLEHYRREDLLVLWSEDLYRDPQAALDATTDHLGLDRHALQDPKPWNVATAEREMLPATRDALREHFAPLDLRLAELIGVRPPWAR